ncbi:hypothetical protein BH24BAC1_BH24BAC1_31390 [soil metagenome]
MKRYPIFLLAALLFSIPSFAGERWRQVSENPDYLHRSVKKVTDVLVEDIFSPPVASRIYAYVSVAGYEAAKLSDPAYVTLAGQIPHLKPVPPPDPGKEYSYSVASVQAVLTVGKALVFSDEKIEVFHQKMMQELQDSGMPKEVFENSVSYGKKVADHILAWSAGDHYKQTRALEKHSFSDDAGTWQPTPPSYMKAVEPHWGKIRPFLVSSAQQFKPLPPTPFSTDEKSQFYKEAKEVYDLGLNLTAEQKAIANFWDCNPFKMNIRGHVMFATKKISPGGHWINITRLACKKVNADLVKSAEAYACLSLTLADSFISCWDEKYRSNVIRPETFINQHIDKNWAPLLQTPPFPEYTSGHSVISTASALMLTKLFGENFSFADSTEVEFGLPVRHFASFKQAAEEAAISRLYGGIHYRPAVVNGVKEGEEIGKFLTQKVRTRKEDLVQKK